ncbi:hypothetical protein NSP_12820 [Nodularia spumigena CCY9414]|nr:hypothetical protein NSP_12820 [Nodularia spumigena CCY9414]
MEILRVDIVTFDTLYAPHIPPTALCYKIHKLAHFGIISAIIPKNKPLPSAEVVSSGKL